MDIFINSIITVDILPNFSFFCFILYKYGAFVPCTILLSYVLKVNGMSLWPHMHWNMDNWTKYPVDPSSLDFYPFFWKLIFLPIFRCAFTFLSLSSLQSWSEQKSKCRFGMSIWNCNFNFLKMEELQFRFDIRIWNCNFDSLKMEELQFRFGTTIWTCNFDFFEN